MSGWVDHAIWWHVYPLGFCGAPVRGEHGAPAPRLQRLAGWLDYAVDLGASGLLLGPIFASATHGYDSLDQLRIDPRLGSESDFDLLVSQCKARGLRLVLDGVFNHVGRGHPGFAQALREGPGSETAALFDVDWHAPGGPRPHVFEGHEALVGLNHDSPETADYVEHVMSYWLNRGIDGWRLDAAYAVEPAFWARVLSRVREQHPGAWFLGEVIHGDYAGFVERSGVDSITQYELWKAVWSSLNDRNFFELDWTLARHNDLLARFTPNTFVGNHDVTRIASAVGPDLAVVALAILCTTGGIPSIYYGDEQGYTGVKHEREGGDDEVRPAFPDSPAQLSAWGSDVYRAHQQLLGLRRRHPWLTTATTETVSLGNTAYRYRAHAREDSRFLDVTLDISERPAAWVRDESGATLWGLEAR